MSANAPFALQIVEELVKTGVREFCVCPGARNSPLAALLLELKDVRVFHHFEERSAAFFALGRIKATQRPVAVVTTSGTAVAELLPATMEAYYTSLPLVLLTADRPRAYRGSGAPQTAEQVGIFGVYAEPALDLAAGEKIDLAGWARRTPLHLNACFGEPLLSPLPTQPRMRLSEQALAELPLSENIRRELRDFTSKARYPMAIVSSLTHADRESVRGFLRATGIPAYFEAQSGLREDPELAPQRVHVADGLLDRAHANGYGIDGVIRIGSVPTLRMWRDLEERKLPVFSLSREPFSGLSGLSISAQPIGLALSGEHPKLTLAPQAFLKRDLEALAEMEALFAKYSRSEPALFRALSQAIGESARLFVGNSLPVREWDMAASFESSASDVSASRGLNGIDGQVSTFLGSCQAGRANWAMLGDLTTLYDLSAPWILPQLSPEIRATLVVINNRGGKIFSRMFPQREFQNPHAIEFSHWAKMWSLPYERWEAIPENDRPNAPLRIVELTPDSEQTDAFWRELSPRWKN